VDRADWLEEACEVIRSLWTQQRTSVDGTHYKLTDAVAEPKPVQRPYPPIWIGGSGRQRTLRITARYADVWNAAGGSPDEVAEVSAVLDQRCAEIGRDPAQIRRSVQLRVAEANDELLELAQSYRAVGVTEIVLILHSQNPASLAEQIAGLLPRLRAT
jgi:alkanesulfonate monooxygenase SsuD/methylene tetrahydromethanopterin reductase-like flavin-dependent oxidoreductase (luciferase family)